MGTIRVIDDGPKKKKLQIGVRAQREERRKTFADDPSTLMATARTLERKHAGRTSENRRYQRLYYAKPFLNTDKQVFGDADGHQMYDLLRRHGANLTAEIIDAGIALLCRRLQPKILPVGGDNELRQACQRVGRVLDGIAESERWLTEFTEVVRAGMNNDIGFALVDVDDATDEIKTWKLDQNYVFWPLDGTRRPQMLVVVMPIPRVKLIAQFPEKENEINNLPSWRPRKVIGVDELGGSMDDVDTVAVARGWTLATGKDRPGRKVTAAGDDLILADEEWPFDFHQVIKFSWKPNATGFGGVPLTRTIAPYDLTNKRLLNRTLAALDGAVPWLLVEEENDIEAISDVEFQRVTFPRGSAPPTVIVPNPVSTQQLDRMEANRAAAFREAHINENAAQGQAPAGFKSAVAQFAWADSVQTILLPQQEAWQTLWKDAADVVVALLQTNKKVRVRLGDMLEEISLPSIARNKYKITFGLVSGLALTVSGRLEQLQQIQAALPNKLDNEDVLRHIGLPDTQQLADRLLAPRELAEYIVQKALDDGELITPPRMLGPDGLAALYRIASQEYCGALKKPRNYYKRQHLEVLRRVTLIADFLQKAPVLPPPATGPAPVQPLPAVNIGSAAAPILPQPISPGGPPPVPAPLPA